jgi:GGDEF domain-containing protein
VLIDLLGADATMMREIGMVLLENTRGCDSVGRLADGQFVVLLKNASEMGAKIAARRLKEAIHALATSRRRMVRVRVAWMGVAADLWPEELIASLRARLPDIPVSEGSEA